MLLNDYLVVLMFLTFICFLFTGFPVAWALGGTGVLFAVVGYLADQFLGTTTGLNFTVLGMAVNRIYKIMDNWVLVAIPMFILMGLLLDKSGIAEKMMKAMQEAFGKLSGGLAITVALIGIVLAASTGIVGASVTLLALLTLPAMLRQGYTKPIATGIVAASGTLGILIPPSIMLVIMADQLALSVGDLFMGAVIPGLILGVLYIVFIIVLGLIKPQTMPLDPERKAFQLGRILWEVFKSVLPAGSLILAVLGSIFAGICTPTEASGVGVLGACVLALINKQLNLGVIKGVLKGTFNTTAYIMAIFIGATIFALVLRSLGGDEFITKVLNGIPFGPYGKICTILGFVFFLGFFLDWIEITLIVLPLLAPVIKTLGVEIDGYGVISEPALVWFVLLIAVCLQTSFLTPPVGFSLFYLQGVCPPEVKLTDIYRGVVPFIILQLIGLVLTLLYPQLVLWLPAKAYGY
ncbi:MAG: TRAP transporter large permease subunit [Deltaproteobacteria bacterium]|nr:TRAP transporter large permease subunit [Deltaproteobacteria bacterium]